jgi:hypothetical protein
MGDYKRLIRCCSATWGEKPLNALSISEITAEIKQKADTASFSARRLRINLSNMFLEAQREGEIPSGHNPALLSRPLLTAVKTERLLFNEWLLIFKAAGYCAPEYFQRTMLLAIMSEEKTFSSEIKHVRFSCLKLAITGSHSRLIKMLPI